jgi:type II secretory pathway pseudopilin PulG
MKLTNRNPILPSSWFDASRRAGFSLTEIVIALGIFSFAIVGLIGLFPVAMDSARVSREETLVVNIARMVMSEIKASPFAAARVVTNRNVDGTDDPGRVVPMNLGIPSSISFGYKLVEDSAGIARWNPVGGQIATPAGAQPGMDFVVTVSSTLSGTSAPLLAQVTVLVEGPASAAQADRRQYPFTVLISE